MTITLYLLLIFTYWTTRNQTYQLLHNTSDISVNNNIKYEGRERNKRIKQSITITIFLLLIVNYRTTINQTYPLLHNPSIHQVVISNIKVENETKGLNKLW